MSTDEAYNTDGTDNTIKRIRSEWSTVVFKRVAKMIVGSDVSVWCVYPSGLIGIHHDPYILTNAVNIPMKIASFDPKSKTLILSMSHNQSIPLLNGQCFSFPASNFTFTKALSGTQAFSEVAFPIPNNTSSDSANKACIRFNEEFE